MNNLQKIIVGAFLYGLSIKEIAKELKILESDIEEDIRTAFREQS